MVKVVQANASFIVCLDTVSGDSIIIPNKIISESILVIHEIK